MFSLSLLEPMSLKRHQEYSQLVYTEKSDKEVADEAVPILAKFKPWDEHSDL